MTKHEEKSFFGRMGDWLDDYWAEAALALLPVLMSCATLFASDEVIKLITNDNNVQSKVRWWSVAAFLALTAFYVIVLWKFFTRRTRASRLIARNAHLESRQAAWIQDVRTISRGYLLDLAGRLKFGSNGTERASLYVHNLDEVFYEIARFSFNPTFNSNGRKSYPQNEGCIGRAWQYGHHFCNSFPDPVVDLDGYALKSKEYKISKGVAEKLRMKSRMYFAWRILDRPKERPLAVLVIESTDPLKFSENELLELFQKDEGRYLSDLIEAILPQIPDERLARERGM